MACYRFLWSDETIDHIADHGISQEEYEQVVCAPLSKGVSRSTGLPTVWGSTRDGRSIMAVYELLDELTVLPRDCV